MLQNDRCATDFLNTSPGAMTDDEIQYASGDIQRYGFTDSFLR